MKTIQEMAREVLLLGERDNPSDDGIAQFIGTLTDFAELVREEAIAEANAKANASWTLMCRKMVEIECDACAELVYNSPPADEYESPLIAVYRAIRARNNT